MDLFTDFNEITATQWLAQAVKELKGKSADEMLYYYSADNLKIKPFYTHEDVADDNLMPLFSHTDWDVCVEVDGTTENDGNAKALEQISGGATAILFWVNHTSNLTELLNELDLTKISTQFVVEGSVSAFIHNLKQYCIQQNLNQKLLRVFINSDLIEVYLRTGAPPDFFEKDLQQIQQAVDFTGTLTINTNQYQNAGASQAKEIGYSLAHLNAYLNHNQFNLTQLKSVQLNVAVGQDYFFEIAKLRALRKGLLLLFKTHQISPKIIIHAETSTVFMTKFDEHNNILRATTASMAAIIGGCNSLVVKPFNLLHQYSDSFSERIARNTQLILKHESYFNQVADVSAGSYFIEYLTTQLAELGWHNFVEIEKTGGICANIQSGKLQNQISQQAQLLLQAFSAGKMGLVGSNKFPNLAETLTHESKQSIKPPVDLSHKKLTPIRLAATYEWERISANSNM